MTAQTRLDAPALGAGNDLQDAPDSRDPQLDPTTPWWRDAVIYQVYPRSFADSDGDGTGDLPGITARLHHLADLGVDALWLSPFYPSPQHDGGYDVADYRNVDPRYGTLADADALIARAHELKLRVIVDLVPNHTSSDHAWFQAAVAAGSGSPERARYHFRPGTGPDGSLPPNGWRSVFGGPAWTRLPDGEWYLHLFDSSQPDLDWENPEVHAEFESVLRFWLDRGVDGFRVDVAHGMVKEPGLPEWTHEQGLFQGADESGARPPMWDQEGVHEIFRAWRQVLDSYPGDRIAVAEAWVDPPSQLVRYVRPDELHQAFNFDYLSAPWRADAQRAVVTRCLEATAGVGAPSTWVLSNHDVLRHPTRFGFETGTELPNGIGIDDAQPDEELGLRRARAATLLMLSLPGSAYLFQGEELGLPEVTTLDDAVRQDPTWFRTDHTQRGRDGCRVPIPWVADAPSYGFGPGPASWLPQPADWGRYAVDAQTGVEGSTLELYRSALRLRREHRIGTADLVWSDAGEDAVAFTVGSVGVLANLGTSPVALPAGARVLLSSIPLTGSGLPDPHEVPSDVTVWFTLS